MKVHVSALFWFAKGAWEIHCILVLFIWDTGIFSRNKLELESWALQYPYQPVCLSLSIYLSISLGTEYICEIIHKTPIGQGSRGPYVSLEMFFMAFYCCIICSAVIEYVEKKRVSAGFFILSPAIIVKIPCYFSGKKEKNHAESIWGNVTLFSLIC